MADHTIVIDEHLVSAFDDDGEPYTAMRYRWHCSCGRLSPWRKSKGNVKWEGHRHAVTASRPSRRRARKVR